MDKESLAAHRATFTSQEDTRVKNMVPATSAAHRETRTI